MAKSNHTKVGEALEILNQGLYPFFEREMQSVHGDQWQEIAKQSLREDRNIDKSASKNKKINWDTQNILVVMWNQWNVVFSKILGISERSLISELREIRNRWAHQTAFNGDDTYRTLDSIERLLTAICAPESNEIKKEKDVYLRARYEEQRRYEQKKIVANSSQTGVNHNDLKPWREIVTPHNDVCSGNYQNAEFAADLWQVYLGDAGSEYQNPVEFFRRTFLTDGLKRLLINAVKRLGKNEGDPVIELQTNFGGGKTHALLALYHLFSCSNVNELTGIDEMLQESIDSFPSDVHRAVIVGTQLSAGSPNKKKGNISTHTLWGEIAWQLGGKEGYEMIRSDDENGTNPGDKLRELFNKFSPCLILIDEWVAYARQLKNSNDNIKLPAGTFDTQFTFAQALSESAKAANKTLLLVSIPVSDNEIGGDLGRQALPRLKNAIGRLESSWSPANSDESFEIVRRRLFEPITDKQAFIDRDVVARAFVNMYGKNHNEFPSECREADYEQRIKNAYPIHPELFDRLYNTWSTLDKFQRTRGVLRLMAAVIHSLWIRQDNNLLIMPSTIPIDDPVIQSELTRYLDEQWASIISADVDGESSLPLRLDSEIPVLGRYSACRRVARTIYIGSAPTLQTAHKGIDETLVKLGCVQPGEQVATFGDAIRRLTDKAMYLYVDNKRYWYSTRSTVTRLAIEKANRVDEREVFNEIHKRLNEEITFRGDFAKIHITGKSNDIPDEREVRLVILPPDFPFNKEENGTKRLAEEILNKRGNSPRQYKNTLIFLAADEISLADLINIVKQYLAWKTINEEKDTLNIEKLQEGQIRSKLNDYDKRVESQILETFCRLLIPAQEQPNGEIVLQDVKLRLSQDDDLIKAILRKLKDGDQIVPKLGDIMLRKELDRIPLWQGDSVKIKQLVEYFASYVYLPRLLNPNAQRNNINKIAKHQRIKH
ncbi:MAG: DUF499 domain-containing protein [Planctomycetaceae bacterium]|jgi:predicted AAA+ superfamily ATPase|nr:DUF499 domain-containing protein [Planctomycetaceae bacterium]